VSLEKISKLEKDLFLRDEQIQSMLTNIQQQSQSYMEMEQKNQLNLESLSKEHKNSLDYITIIENDKKSYLDTISKQQLLLDEMKNEKNSNA